MLRDREATLVERALSGPVGATCLARARQRLAQDVERNRFSAERAERIYISSIDAAVWGYVGSSSLGSIIYRNHILGEERLQMARRFAHTFAQEAGATEGRAPSRWLAFGR